jgi:hypothetical protein
VWRFSASSRLILCREAWGFFDQMLGGSSQLKNSTRFMLDEHTASCAGYEIGHVSGLIQDRNQKSLLPIR